MITPREEQRIVYAAQFRVFGHTPRLEDTGRVAWKRRRHANGWRTCYSIQCATCRMEVCISCGDEITEMCKS